MRIDDRVRKIMNIYREASFQSHAGHWDSSGTGGANCQECIRARRLRSQADKLLDDLLEEEEKNDR